MNNQKHLYNKLLVVDSSKRDKKIYPNSNSYTIHLSTEYRNVEEIELINMFISDSLYTINSSNNYFEVTYNENIIKINIPFGSYLQEKLATKISKIFNINKIDIKCIWLDELKKFAFQNNNNNNFELNFNFETSIGQILGFDKKKYNMNIFEGKITLEKINSKKIKLISNKKNIELIENIAYLDNNLNQFEIKYCNYSILIDFKIDKIIKIEENNIIIELNNCQNISNFKNNSDIEIEVFFIISSKCADLYSDKFIILEIEEFNRLDSNTTLSKSNRY